LLILAAIVGAPVSAAAYGFLQLVSHLQKYFFVTLPDDLGFDGAPAWWPLLPLFAAGVLVGLTIRYLPGRGGHSPADGFKPEGPPSAAELPGVFLAALASLSLGVVLGPEAPLMALGGGLAALTVRLVKRDAPERAHQVIGSAGSFAAISTLFGNPLFAAFLLMEAAGLGGPTLGAVLLPGLLASGIGTLVFIGLDALTGLGTASLALPTLPAFDRPNIAMFGYAIAFGLVAAVAGSTIHRLALFIRPHVEERLILLTPIVGLAIAALAIMFSEISGRSTSDVLFSGQAQLPTLVGDASNWSVGALLLVIVCKSVGYSLSLSSFRGGPVFPSLFIGAAAGFAASHLPGLPLTPAVAMGIGAMACAMLRLPLTSVLLASVLLPAESLNVMPLVIVAVVVAYVVTARLSPAPSGADHAVKR
jgi:H+/Cl- antiporter ClcA